MPNEDFEETLMEGRELMVVRETQFSQSENTKDLVPMKDQEGVP